MNSNNDMPKYAPVLIPTLNRYEHFRKCLESLERCTGAEFTDVYIGLDYPPSDKYVEGWQQIDTYLAEKEKCHGFNRLYVHRRDHNCGVGKKGGNATLLRLEITPKVDYYILSEDDNEFSTNFLDYMNKMLELYKNDSSVIAVCGYLFPDVKLNIHNTYFLSPSYTAWGIGLWSNKSFNFKKVGSKNYIQSILYSFNKSLKLFSKRARSLNGILSMHLRGEIYGDVVKTAEMLLEDKYSVFPTISKVRNWGHDGSGVHCGFSENYQEQQIDVEKVWNYTVGPKETVNITRYTDVGFIGKIAVLIRYFCFRIFKKDVLGFYFNHRIK